jgi:hypothetical protein
MNTLFFSSRESMDAEAEPRRDVAFAARGGIQLRRRGFLASAIAAGIVGAAPGLARAIRPIVRRLTFALFRVGRSLELWLTLLGRTDEMIAESLVATLPPQTESDRCNVNVAGLHRPGTSATAPPGDHGAGPRERPGVV